MVSAATPQRRPTSKLMSAVVVLMLALIAFMPIGLNVIGHGYVVLTPDRTDDEFTLSIALGVGTAVITVTLLLWFRPKLRRELRVIAPTFGLIALLIGFLLGIAPAKAFWSVYDFRKRPLRESDSFLRVSRFHIMHGRGKSYLLDLSDFSPSLDLYWDDYRRGTGGRDEVATPDGCIRVRLQRSGRSLRMIQPEHVLVVRCPAQAGIVGAS